MSLAPDNLDPSAVALFLDVDGTLLDLRDHPGDVCADARLVELLEACSAKLGGAMSLVSGRSVAELDRIFAPARFPVAGAHGAELRLDENHMVTITDVPLPERSVQSLEAFAARHDGLLLEHKRGGLALHYRRAPEHEPACRRLVMRIMGEAGDAFRLVAGKMVLEIAPRAHHKGTAIGWFLQEPPFAGRVPVFIGDDVTDEDGFRTVNDMAGISIRIGGNDDSEARYCLADVAAVRPWLRDAVLGGHPELRYGDQSP